MRQTPDLRVEHELFVRSMLSVSPPTRVVRQMADRMLDCEFITGEIIFQQGHPSHRLFFVVDGQVALESASEPAWLFERGSMLGIVDATLSRKHARTARARTDAHLISIEYEDYIDILEDNFDFAKTTLERAMATMFNQGLALAPDHVFATEDLRGEAPIPHRPGQDVAGMQRLLALRDVSALAHAPVQPLVTLARSAEVLHWAKNAKILEAGKLAETIQIVVSGDVRVHCEHPLYEATFGPGSILGALAALATPEHPHHAQALTECTTLSVAKEDIFDVIEDHFGLARRLLGWVAADNERSLGRSTRST